jgi:hypothetical protein
MVRHRDTPLPRRIQSRRGLSLYYWQHVGHWPQQESPQHELSQHLVQQPGQVAQHLSPQQVAAAACADEAKPKLPKVDMIRTTAPNRMVFMDFSFSKRA